MKLVKLREFKSIVFSESSAPADSTLRKQIDSEEIPGGTRHGSRYYVDMDEYNVATNLRAKLRARGRELAQDPRLQGLV